MPRRARHIFTIIFLLLITGTLAHVVLHWSAPDPLRFHFERYEPASAEDFFGIVHLRVTNTSHVPVYLYVAEFEKALQPGSSPTLLGTLTPHLQKLGPRSTPHMLFFAPGDSMSCVVHILKDEKLSQKLENVEITYQWRSSITERLWTFWVEYIYPTPAVVRDLMPTGPGHFKHHATLESPATPPQER